MTASEKHREEQEEIRNARMNRIFSAAFDLFAERGIEPISMNEIAVKAEIGVASLYRYFSTKDKLAVEVASYAWKKTEKLFSVNIDQDSSDLTGLQQLEILFGKFAEALDSFSAFYRFIYYFDSFVKRENLTFDELERYENNISSSKDSIVAIFQKGIDDGSINIEKLGVGVDEVYFTIMHGFFSMAQKLALSGSMLNMDTQVSPKRQLEIMLKLMLEALK